MTTQPKRKRQPCRYHRCTRDATCLPRLYVPASKLSLHPQVDDVSALLGLQVCNVCFSKLTAREFLQGERGEAIRAAIELEFRKRGAYPNFDKAVIGRVSQSDLDYGRFEVMQERARQN